ncbi:MAG: hypothetical protein PHP39_10135, partial [Oscillospiraceae bacterium]|nr:hypothetical protein [Oscillospiraceae bacterium]
ALHKAKRPPQGNWFCGDNVIADIEGADKAGLTPVWYDPWPDTGSDRKRQPRCPHLHIKDWAALSACLSD